MSKFNMFTAEQKALLNLAVDTARYSVVDSHELSKETITTALKNKTFAILNIDENSDLKARRRAFRRNKAEIYEIIEEMVDITVAQDVFNSAFVQQFVEVKNRGIGDMTRFTFDEGSHLVATAFAGNHWTVNRQKLGNMGAEIVLPAKWVAIRVYDEFERFILNLADLSTMMDAMYKAINKYISSAVYAQFQNISSIVPSHLQATGNGGDGFVQLAELVAATGGYSNITLAGTRLALRKLTKSTFTDPNIIANSQKEAFANTGSIQTWEGYNLMIIPQTLKAGTVDKLALDDSKIYILGADIKPIKVELYGDSRTLTHNNDGSSNGSELADQTIDVQVHTKIGIGMVLPPAFGVYTIQ